MYNHWFLNKAQQNQKHMKFQIEIWTIFKENR